jgi:hypothetical protein
MNEAPKSPSAEVDEKIASVGGWRGDMLSRLRGLIKQADPAMTESIKWRKATNPLGVPVWEHAGIVCTGEVYKDKVKLTFMLGAAVPDPTGLFNAPGTGGTRRAIDIPEGGSIDEAAFKALVRAAVSLNMGKGPGQPRPRRKA